MQDKCNNCDNAIYFNNLDIVYITAGVRFCESCIIILSGKSYYVFMQEIEEFHNLISNGKRIFVGFREKDNGKVVLRRHMTIDNFCNVFSREIFELLSMRV